MTKYDKQLVLEMLDKALLLVKKEKVNPKYTLTNNFKNDKRELISMFRTFALFKSF